MSWDGNERRSTIRRDNDDVFNDLKELISQLLIDKNNYRQITPYLAPLNLDKDISHGTLNVKDVLTVVGLVGSGLISGFLLWISLTNQIDRNYNEFTLFKTQISRSAELQEKKLDDLKKSIDDFQKELVGLRESTTQIYNQISRK